MPEPKLSLLDRLRTVSAATSVRELDTGCAHLIQTLGFAFFAVFVMPTQRRQTGQFIFGNAPAEWHGELADLHLGWLRQWPVPAWKSTLPYCWDKPLHVAKPSSSRVSEEATRCLLYGLTAMVVTAGKSAVVMSLMRPEELPASDHAQYQLLSQTYFLANITVDAWHRVEKTRSWKPQPRAPYVLTPRERQCLTLAAEGDTSIRIAARLGISKRTAAFHIDRAIRKLQVHSRAAAVKQAMLTGQITPALTEGDVHMTA